MLPGETYRIDPYIWHWVTDRGTGTTACPTPAATVMANAMTTALEILILIFNSLAPFGYARILTSGEAR